MGGSLLELQCESMRNSRKKKLNRQIDRYRDKLIQSLDRRPIRQTLKTTHLMYGQIDLDKSRKM